jgi:hypothetical protein
MKIDKIYNTETIHAAYAGKMPKSCRHSFMVAANRAQALLKNRSEAEIFSQIDVLMWMLHEVRTSSNSTVDLPDNQKRILTTTASVLYGKKDDFKLDDVGNLSWPENFAFLALCNIADALFIEVFAHDGTETSISDYISIIGDCASAAVEAVCFGERILHETKLVSGLDVHVKTKLKEQISLRASHASIARHSKVNAIKQRFFKYWRSGTFPSGAEAARRFYDSLPAEQQKLLSKLGKDRAVRTLCSALAELKQTSDNV